jgi:hypothetical protein
MHRRWYIILWDWVDPIIKVIFGGCFTKKTMYGTRKWKNEFFVQRKWKTPYGNIVQHSKSHIFAQYKIISTNYAMFMLKTLVMWLESPETSFMIALFCEHFFKMFAIFKIWYFVWQIGHIKWLCAKVFRFFDFFLFLMPVWKCIQNGGRDL